YFLALLPSDPASDMPRRLGAQRQPPDPAPRAPFLASRGRGTPDRAWHGIIRAHARPQAKRHVAFGDGRRRGGDRPGRESKARLDDQRRGGAAPLARGPAQPRRAPVPTE